MLNIWKYLHTAKPLVLIPILSKNIYYSGNGDVINGNEVRTYDQAYDSNGELTEKFSKVITI